MLINSMDDGLSVPFCEINVFPIFTSNNPTVTKKRYWHNNFDDFLIENVNPHSNSILQSVSRIADDHFKFQNL